MNYIERTIRSAPGLSQEDALESLQSHKNFRPGTKIASLRRRGDRWVATLLLPKTAAFPPEGGDDAGEDGPPKEEKKDDAPDDAPDGPDDSAPDDGPDGPPSPDGGDGEKKPKGGPEEQILHVLTEILHALKGGPVGPGLGGPDDMGPGPDAMGPPPHGGPGLPPGPPAGPKGGMGIGAKLKPGEVPNKPGVVVPGQPAFSSVNNPLAQHIAKLAGRKRHISVSSPAGLTVKQAKAELDPVAAHFGYHVAQVRYCGPNCQCKTPGSAKIHALLEAN